VLLPCCRLSDVEVETNPRHVVTHFCTAPFGQAMPRRAIDLSFLVLRISTLVSVDTVKRSTFSPCLRLFHAETTTTPHRHAVTQCLHCPRQAFSKARRRLVVLGIPSLGSTITSEPSNVSLDAADGKADARKAFRNLISRAFGITLYTGTLAHLEMSLYRNKIRRPLRYCISRHHRSSVSQRPIRKVDYPSLN
jgi:hypothetical protein